MIDYHKFILGNGLRVVVHLDKSTPLVSMNVLYMVGARDESPDRTGFAHLFEHLMFGGSANVPVFDQPLEMVGGENNAFTTNDLTNYYLTVPWQNIETGFWIESDRMYQLAITEKSLGIQRDVVVEEFKQTHLNQPYGDVWLLMRPLAYKAHPYMWSTIGKEPSHIENATISDVIKFYKKFYNPNNAVLVLSGNIELNRAKELSEKWFGNIKNQGVVSRDLPVEPVQKEPRTLEVVRNVPQDAVYMAWHMCKRNSPEYHAMDLISDILGSGNSSRLYSELVMKRKMFSELTAYITGSIDEGLFVIAGKLNPGVKIPESREAIADQINKIKLVEVGERELQKVKNRIEASHIFSQTNITEKAMNLAFYEILGDAGLVNQEVEKYMAVSEKDIKNTASRFLNDDNSSLLIYKSTQTD